LLATPGALAALREAQVHPLALFRRHANGDWGDLHADDEQLVQAGVRVFFYLEDRERTLDSPADKDHAVAHRLRG
jgi:hypothetical protein